MNVTRCLCVGADAFVRPARGATADPHAKPSSGVCDYSYRRAVMGLIRMARRAGM